LSRARPGQDGSGRTQFVHGHGAGVQSRVRGHQAGHQPVEPDGVHDGGADVDDTVVDGGCGPRLGHALVDREARATPELAMPQPGHVHLSQVGGVGRERVKDEGRVMAARDLGVARLDRGQRPECVPPTPPLPSVAWIRKHGGQRIPTAVEVDQLLVPDQGAQVTGREAGGAGAGGPEDSASVGQRLPSVHGLTLGPADGLVQGGRFGCGRRDAVVEACG
jgi:hypothetical protein